MTIAATRGVGLPRTVLLLCCLTAGASCGVGPNSARGRLHDIESAPIDGAPISAQIAVGDVARVKGPPIVVHPDFAGAEVAVEFNTELLTLIDRQMDRSQLGQSVQVLQFRAKKTGTAEIVLRLTGTAKPVERTTRYRLEIRD